MPSPYWQHVVSARRSACVLEPCFLHSPTRELVGVVVVVGGEGVVASAATAASDQSSSPIQKDACTTLFPHVPFPLWRFERVGVEGRRAGSACMFRSGKF